jgi:ankyrin repeat protein
METEEESRQLLNYLSNRKGYTREKDDEWIQKININNNINLNITNNSGRTPLILALMNEKNNIANSLIEKGANVNLADNDGDTPILWAAIKDNFDIATQLINKGANVDVEDSLGKTPLDFAKENGNDELYMLFLTYMPDKPKSNNNNNSSSSNNNNNNNNNSNNNNSKSSDLIPNKGTALAAVATILGLGGIITAITLVGGNQTKKNNKKNNKKKSTKNFKIKIRRRHRKTNKVRAKYK